MGNDKMDGAKRSREETEGQIQQLQQYLYVIEQQLSGYRDEQVKLEMTYMDFLRGRETLQAILESKVTDEVAMPVGGGIALYATMQHVDRVMVNAGADVTVELPPQEALDSLNKRITLLEDTAKKISELIEGYTQQRQTISSQIQGLQQDSVGA